MPIQANVATDILDLNHVGDQLVVQVQQYAVATVQATVLTGAWGSTDLDIQCSNDGIAFEDLDDPITMEAAGLTARIDVSGFSYLRARVTTAAGADATGQVTILGKGS